MDDKKARAATFQYFVQQSGSHDGAFQIMAGTVGITAAETAYQDYCEVYSTTGPHSPEA